MSNNKNTKEVVGFYKVGTIVTLKTHPLAFQENGLIDSHISHIPPFMCIKEVHIEHKKHLFNQESGELIADKIKYLCVYFNQQRQQFEEKFIYASMLIALAPDKFIFHNNDDDQSNISATLIEETLKYDAKVKFKYGDRVFFKTHKLEKRKKFKNSRAASDGEQFRIAMAHTSPAFVISGTKKNEMQDLFYEKDGEPKRIVANTLVKVLWYNSYQEKISEGYQPKEFFTDNENIFNETKTPKSSS